MTNLMCPACGNTNLTKKTQKKIIVEPFGGSKEIEIVSYLCPICETEGDFDNENENILNQGLDSLKKKAVENILDDFIENHYNLASIERALEIPQRTLSRWRKGTTKPSAAGNALLKMLRLFPWLLEVAEQKYDYSSAQRIHIGDAFSQVLKHMTFDGNSAPQQSTTTNFTFTQIQMSMSFNQELTHQESDDGINFVPTYILENESESVRGAQ